ncbi:MAG: thioesterase family protein [Nocardioides sp.]
MIGESGGKMDPVDEISTGLKAAVTHTVGEVDTALAVGSGDLPVLGTPRLLAWAEEATCAALADHLPAARTSVGTRVQLEHVGASPVGAEVEVTATVAYSDGRLVRFEVVAEHVTDQKVVGHGEITRVVVDRDRFLSRLA